MSRRGRPLGDVSLALLRLAGELGAITAPLAARELQLSLREASRATHSLREAGHLVPAPRPAIERAAPGRPAQWLALPEIDLGQPFLLEDWLRH